MFAKIFHRWSQHQPLLLLLLTITVSLIVAVTLWSAVLFSPSLGDERENYVAGWFIYNNLIPYRDFFFHHGPFPFFIAAIGYLFTSEPWVLYRIFMLIWWMIWGICAIILARRPQVKIAISITWMLSALSSPLLDLHYLLAEPLIVPPLLGSLFLLSDLWLSSKRQYIRFWTYWGIAGWVAIWSTPVALLPFGWLGVGAMVLARKEIISCSISLIHAVQHSKKKSVVCVADYVIWLWVCAIIALLHLIIVLFFSYHQALEDAWWAIIKYNTQYYFPIRLATNNTSSGGYIGFITANFSNYYLSQSQAILDASFIALLSIKGLLLDTIRNGEITLSLWNVVWHEWSKQFFTIQTFSAVSLTTLLIALLLSKSWTTALWLIIFLITLRNRDNEFFKLSVFYIPILALTLLFFIESVFRRKLLLSTWLSVLLLSWVSFTSGEHILETRKPSLYFPAIEEAAAQEVLQNNEIRASKKVLYLGGNPDLYVLTRTLPPMKYYYYHSWFHAVPPIQASMRTFLENNKTYPILLESHLIGEDVVFAQEFEEFIQSEYEWIAPGIYAPKRDL